MTQPWKPWLDLEEFLKEQRIKFTWHPNFKINDIALDHARRINGRIEKLSKDKIDQYKEVLRVGAMPGVVLAKFGDEYVALDGIQRTHAAKGMKMDTIGAYVVEGEPARLNDLATSINMRFNGLELKPEERKNKLREEVRNILSEHGKVTPADREELAVRWQFGIETVRSIERGDKARDTMRAAGVSRPQRYDDDRAFLIARVGDAEAIRVLAKFVDEKNPATNDLRMITNAAREEITPENRMKVLDAHIRTAQTRTSRYSHTRSATTGRSRRGQFDASRVPGMLAQLASVNQPANLKETLAWLSTKPDLDEIIANLAAIELLVKRLQSKLKA